MIDDEDDIGLLGCPECGEDGELVSVWRCVNCGLCVCDACCAPSYLCIDCDEELPDESVFNMDEDIGN